MGLLDDARAAREQRDTDMHARERAVAEREQKKRDEVSRLAQQFAAEASGHATAPMKIRGFPGSRGWVVTLHEAPDDLSVQIAVLPDASWYHGYWTTERTLFRNKLQGVFVRKANEVQELHGVEFERIEKAFVESLSRLLGDSQ